MRFRYSFAWLLVVVAVLSGTAAAQRVGDKRNAGPGIDYTYVGSYSVNDLRRIVTTDAVTFLQEVGSPFPTDYFPDRMRSVPKFSVKLYKVSYETVVPELGDRTTRASGLVAIPDVKGSTLPMVSYQHGTVFYKDAVPSEVNLTTQIDETKLMLGVFASQGYIVIGADYVGLGESDLPNTYFVRKATVQACVDMYYAAQEVIKAENKRTSQFFVHGWSQGGYNTLAFLRELERRGIKVDAASTAAAPTDLRVWINRLMNNRQQGDAPWIVSAAANLIMALDTYELPGLAEEAINPDYLPVTRRFYNFEADFFEFIGSTPQDPKDFFNPGFLASGKFGGTPFWNLLESNENYRWAMSTPLRNYFGEVDEAVPPGVAKLPATIAGLMGTRTVAISAGGKADHRGAYLFSLTEVPSWYRQFMK